LRIVSVSILHSFVGIIYQLWKRAPFKEQSSNSLFFDNFGSYDTFFFCRKERFSLTNVPTLLKYEDKWLFSGSKNGKMIPYVGHNVPAGLYGTSTKEENVPFSSCWNPKSSQIGMSLQDPRILRILVRGWEGSREIPEGIGEGYSKRYLTMRNRRFRMFKYLWEGWLKFKEVYNISITSGPSVPQSLGPSGLDKLGRKSKQIKLWNFTSLIVPILSPLIEGPKVPS